MDHAKLDAPLAAAIEAAEDLDARTLAVFVHLDPARAPASALAELGLSPPPAQSRLTTATLSPRQVDELSEQGRVQRLGLASWLRLLGDQ